MDWSLGFDDDVDARRHIPASTAPWRHRALGHYYTIAGHLQGYVGRRLPIRDEAWVHTLGHAAGREIPLTGWLREVPGSTRLVIFVHGVGGCADSGYMLRGANTAASLGMSSLRLNLRGADRRGADFYHAGQSEDIASVLADPRLGSYSSRYLCGYSLGGHISLHYAATASSPGAAAVVAVCPPLDLDATAWRFDRANPVYRHHVLRGLKQMYRALAASRPSELPCPIQRAARIRSIREWDDCIVAPRYGFDSAKHYYDSVSVGGLLGAVSIPALIVAARYDPMVPYDTVAAWLEALPRHVQSRLVERAGHVGFPRRTQLGLDGPKGLESQILSWLDQAGAKR